MNSEATVSVIIPTFNRASLLVETLDCVLAQTGVALEVIVVDDGSTDDTARVVASYGNRVTYLHHANRGLGASRNRGIAAAHGEFLAFPDDDDLWEPEFLALSLALLRRFTSAAFSFGNFRIIRDGAPLRGDGLRGWHPNADFRQLFGAPQELTFHELGLPGTAQAPSVSVHPCDIYAASLHGPWVLPAAAVVRRRSLPDDIRFAEFDLTCCDWEFFARLSRRGGALLIAREIAVNRSHETPNRLTRLPISLQLSRRMAMIDRLWCSDAEFMRDHGDTVNTVLHDCLVQFARLRLLEGQRHEARVALARARRLRPRAGGRLRAALRLASSVPGSARILRVLREWRHRLAS